MDIHSNIYITKIKRSRQSGYYDENIEVEFFDNINQINFDKDVIKVKEYHGLKISNQSKGNILYVDVFDIIQNENLVEDKNGDKYLENGEVNIINHQSRDKNNILVPGYYMLKLKSDKFYYAIFEVLPKDLSKLEWKELYDDVNNYVNGLSRSHSNKNNSKVIPYKQENNLYEKINYLHENYKSIVQALNQIKISPRQNIKKDYEWVVKNEQPQIDKKSMKIQTKNPSIKDYLYSYKRYTNYSIQENIWLRHTIESLLKSINSIHNELVDVLRENERISKSVTYNNVIDQANQTLFITKRQLKEILVIKNGLLNLTKEEWYESIEKKRYVSPTQASLMDFKYNVIFKWYKEFNKSKLDLKFSEKIQNSWKKTDELYEIWCFIKLIVNLEEIGFVALKGWIFDENGNSELEDETIVTMKREELILNLHYNSFIRRNSKKTSLSHPLYTNAANNKPDIRIDIHINDIYMKSIPIDAKYRNLASIIDKGYGSVNQLLAYRDHPRSNLHLEGAKEYRKNNHTVINKVAVLFPKDKETKVSTKKYTRDDNIEFFEMSPGYFDESFIEMLEKEFKDMYDLYLDTY